MAKKKHQEAQDGQLSRAGWIRGQIIQRPDITFEQLLTAYEKAGLPKGERPKDIQVIYQARNSLMKRYGLNSVEEIPRKPNGELNMAGLVRLFRKLHPDFTDEAAKNFFAQDGIKVSDAILHYVRYNPEKQVVSNESPDENQDAGPRAGADTRKKREPKGKRRRRTKEERLSELKDEASTYERWERQCEALMAEAEHLGDSAMVKAFRQARRAASAGVLQRTT